MIEVKNLVKNFGNKKVLKNLSFRIDDGELIGLIGPNGSGKTTMINCILNFISYDGSISISNLSSEKCFYIPDENILPDLLTGEEYVKFVLSLYKKKYGNEVKSLVNEFAMQNDMQKYLKEYSYGMKKKIQLIISFIINPKLLILDEIFRGLDIEAIVVTKAKLIAYVSKGGTVLLSSHDILAVEQICTKALMLFEGSIQAFDSPKKLLEDYKTRDMEQLFLRLQHGG